MFVVKKTYINNPNLNNKENISEKLSDNQVKTTDVNILLNRVRLDRKKILKKRLLFSLILVLCLSLVVSYTII